MKRIRSFWKSAILNLRRAPKDKRARLTILRFVLMVVFGVYLLLNLLNPGTWIMAPFALFMLYAIRRSHKEADATRFNLNVKVAVADGQEYSEHSAYLARTVIILAATLDRAMSEALVHGERWSGEGAGSRGRINSMLRAVELWDGLAPELRDRMTLPDGSWSSAQVAAAVLQVEDLSVMRWVLQIDKTIHAIEQVSDPNPLMATEITLAPQSVLSRISCLPPWELRTTRDYAWRYFIRCASELKKRGITKNSEFGIPSYWWSGAEKVAGNQNEDFLLGTKIISEASNEQIRQSAVISLRRAQTLGRIVEYLGTNSKHIEFLDGDWIKRPEKVLSETLENRGS